MPEILIEPQPDTPLVISLLRVYSPESQVYEILYNVTNVGKKNILAYAISKIEIVAGQERKGIMWTDLDLTNAKLQSSRSMRESYAFEASLKQTPSTVTLSIDFIEFEDGTTWGADSTKVAERIAGQRYGARELSNRLLKMLEAGGIKAVMDALESSALDFAPPTGHSPEWNQAFINGTNIVRTRLNKAMERGGLNQVERELLDSISKMGGAK